jgi:hypothetical protein
MYFGAISAILVSHSAAATEVLLLPVYNTLFRAAEPRTAMAVASRS